MNTSVSTERARAGSMRVDQIKVGVRLRAQDPNTVRVLVESIATIGLTNPIVVRDNDELLAGLNRLAAVKILGWTTVPVIVLTVEDTEAALVEIDENLARKDLTPLERGEHTQRRKQLYERAHPQSRRGGTPGRAGGGKQTGTTSVPSFVADVAARTGRGASTIAEDARIGTIAPAARELIRGTALEHSKVALLQIARAPLELHVAMAEQRLANEQDQAPKVKSGKRASRASRKRRKDRVTTQEAIEEVAGDVGSRFVEILKIATSYAAALAAIGGDFAEVREAWRTAAREICRLIGDPRNWQNDVDGRVRGRE